MFTTSQATKNEVVLKKAASDKHLRDYLLIFPQILFLDYPPSTVSMDAFVTMN